MTTRDLGERRLNPFAFPAETNVRFVLLIVAAVMLAFNLGVLLPIATNLERPLPTVDPIALDTPGDEFFIQTQTQYLSYLLELLQYLAFPTLLLLSVFALALLIYRTHPARVRRRRALKPLSPDQDGALHRETRHLAQTVGLWPPPVVELGKGLRSQNAQAFGLRNRYAIRLDDGLRLLLRKSPSAFQAIFLHELAHIANQDVGRTYFAQALWIAAVVLTIVPLSIALGVTFIQGIVSRLLAGSMDWQRFFFTNLPTFSIVAVQVGLTLAIVAAIRAGLLRVREVYADWRAALWGAEAPLAGILRQSTREEKSEERIRLWRLHPTARERLAALRTPSILFRVTPDLPFIAGLLLGILMSGLFSFELPAALGMLAGIQGLVASLALQAQANGSMFLIRLAFVADAIGTAVLVISVLASVLGSGYLVAGTVGLQVQREAVADLSSRRCGFSWYLRLLVPSALIALGIEVGFLIVPLALLSPVGLAMGETLDNPLKLLLPIPWMVAVAGSTWLGLIYTRYFAGRLFGAHVGASPPKWKRRLLTLALSGLLLIGYLPLLAARILILYSPGEDLTPFMIALLAGPLLNLIAFGGTRLTIWAIRFVWRSQCPTCREVTPSIAVGRACERCGHELTPWLLAAPPSTH